MTDLWVLTHRDDGLIQTFRSKRDANDALFHVLEDEPESAGKLLIEPFDFVVAEPPSVDAESAD